MNEVDRPQSESRGTALWPLLIVAAAAIVMGLPTLRGSLVGGDDHRLLLNHILVNHPSFEHAFKLFTIFHRDLYQPLPLLSFSAEFAVANLFGLFDQGIEAGAWLFHLTNILMHAVNALLVWWLIALLQQPVTSAERTRKAGDTLTAPANDATRAGRTIATIAALFFAIHPLQVEVIAWTNGRMMLMSTMFGIASMIALSRWLDNRRGMVAALTVVLVVFCGMSKVRVGLPILLAIVPLARRARVSRRVVALWAVCTLAMAVFAYVNVQATASADLFAFGADHLTGPRIVRILMALTWYFQHFLWPTGLASYYPTPPTVYWSHALNVSVIATMLVACAIIVWSSWRSRTARLGFLWFFATISSTLPFVPARNILAADRYMYLPIIGLVWMLAVLLQQYYSRLISPNSNRIGTVATAILGCALAGAMIATGWHVAPFYEDSIKKTTRIARLFPDTPRVWEKVGWSYYSRGQYETAIEYARKELRHDAPTVRGGAIQLMGMSHFHLGNSERALELLHEGAELDPSSAIGSYRLGFAYAELGRTEQAIKYLKLAVDAAPMHNPTINYLASVLQKLGRTTEARKMYEKALANNPYEVPAMMGLAEMEIQIGTPRSLHSARQILSNLLDEMPGHADALTNLGAVYVALGDRKEAISVYQQALESNPNQTLAALNLAQLHVAAGAPHLAAPLFESALRDEARSVDEMVTICEFFHSRGQTEKVLLLWQDWITTHPGSREGRVFFAWTLAISGHPDEALTQLDDAGELTKTCGMAAATRAYISLSQGDYDQAVEATGKLAAMRANGAAARRRLLGALETFDQTHADIPWTFCLAAQLLLADGNVNGAVMSVQLCSQRCADDKCRGHIQRLERDIEAERTTRD